nr:hypothetical protein 1 [ssRNA positive-strand virus sp.]
MLSIHSTCLMLTVIISRIFRIVTIEHHVTPIYSEDSVKFWLRSASVPLSLPHIPNATRFDPLEPNTYAGTFVGHHVSGANLFDPSCMSLHETLFYSDACAKALPKDCPAGSPFVVNSTWYGLHLTLCYGAPHCTCPPHRICECSGAKLYPVYKPREVVFNRVFYLSGCTLSAITTNGTCTKPSWAYMGTAVPSNATMSDVINLVPLPDLYFMQTDDEVQLVTTRCLESSFFVAASGAKDYYISIESMTWKDTCLRVPNHRSQECEPLRRFQHESLSGASYDTQLFTSFPLVHKHDPGFKIPIRKFKIPLHAVSNDKCIDSQWPPAILYMGRMCHATDSRLMTCVSTVNKILPSISLHALSFIQPIIHYVETLIQRFVSFLADIIPTIFNFLLSEISKFMGYIGFERFVLLIIGILNVIIISDKSVVPTYAIFVLAIIIGVKFDFSILFLNAIFSSVFIYFFRPQFWKDIQFESWFASKRQRYALRVQQRKAEEVEQRWLRTSSLPPPSAAFAPLLEDAS